MQFIFDFYENYFLGDDKSETGKHSDKSSDDKSGTDSDSPNLNLMQLKRPFIDVEKIEESGASTTDDETKRKKRKETDNVTKENKSTAAGNRNLSRQDKTQSKTANLTNKSLWNLEGKSPTPSPKPPKLQESDAEVDDPSKSSTDDGPKVPPLKIVIPQQTSTADQEVGGNVKTNKNTSNRNQNALPYVLVASENSGEKETSASTGSLSPDFTKDKESAKNSEERAQQRVLRSALRAQGGSVSNNSSPQNSASPSPSFVAVCDTNSQMGGSTNAGDDSASAQVSNNAASGNSTEETASANNNNNNQSSNSNSGVNSNTGNSVNSGNNETNNQAAATSNTTNQSASNQNNENDNAAQGNNNASDTSNNNNSAAPGNSGANKEQATNQLSNTNQNSNSASTNAEKNSNTNGDNSGNQTSNATSSDSDGNSSNKNGSSSGSAQSTTGTTAQQPASDNETRNTSSPANQSAFIPSNDLHPRKRKIKTNKESSVSTPAQPEEKSDASNADVPPTEQPYNNCYQMFLNIRKQIDRKHRNLVPIAPKPPEGFKDYLMNTRNYMLAGKTSSELDMISMPADIPEEMKTLFISQEKERHKLKLQHIVEKEKLVLSVEQEIVRVHCKTARSKFHFILSRFDFFQTLIFLQLYQIKHNHIRWRPY